MDAATRHHPRARGTKRVRLSPISALMLTVAFGLAAGFLDVAIIVLKKLFLHPEGFYRIARDFPWSVPAGHVVLMAVPGLLSVLTGWFLPRRALLWALATLAAWGALLRLPLYGACSLVMAAGLGRLVADRLNARDLSARRLIIPTSALVGVLALLAAGSTGRQMLRERRAVTALPAPPPRARNVVLLVWDTVRAYSLSLHPAPRDTTPNLREWSKRGVEYNMALAPAPWTFPSHTCFLTGRWPLALDSQWTMELAPTTPTLAEYLASKGYQTAGFVANTNCCTYESGLDRGFAHYEDYETGPTALLARTVPGKWALLETLRYLRWHHAEKWADLESRDAGAITDAFLAWLDRCRDDRPFFVFLNEFDAHMPYIPPDEFAGRFGVRPRTEKDYRFIKDFIWLNKQTMSLREMVTARDRYEDCIAYMDAELGRLLGELGRRGLLPGTDVIVTSDHGEGLGDHGIVGHSYSVNLDEVGVPLVILSAEAPGGRVVYEPVTLRDLPATVAERLGLAEGSPFPGGSLATYWAAPTSTALLPSTSPAFSERLERTSARPGPGGQPPAFEMSVVAGGHHYIREGSGVERLHNLKADPLEYMDLRDRPEFVDRVKPFRRRLLKILESARGTDTVERGYLRNYRSTLRALVDADAGERVADAHPQRPPPDRNLEGPGIPRRTSEISGFAGRPHPG